jgi:hypothetical protein
VVAAHGREEQITPIIFLGGHPASAVESLVLGAQEAAALDTIDRLARVGVFARPIVATSSDQFAARLAERDVLTLPDEGEFHFGRVLGRIIEEYGVARPFYIGGGSAPLLGVDELAAAAETLLAAEGRVVANNFFSSDFVAFSPGDAIRRIEPPGIDNDLAFRLQRQAGLDNVPLPRTVGTQFDLDTPLDLAILALHPEIGARSREYLATADLTEPTSRLRVAMRAFTDPNAEVLVAGRVGTHVLAHLETDLACRKRVFSEERGMRASGREARGEVRSLLGFLLETSGPARFFESLAQLGQVCILDSRVIFSHLGLRPSAADRFNSDLLAAESISDSWVREFTLAAREAPVPVLLGGHSLVSGGLWALVDAAWRERDGQRAGM